MAGRSLGVPVTGPVTHAVFLGEVLRLHRLEVGWQREDRREGILGALERVLERGGSMERWDQTRQETQREARSIEALSPPLSLSPPLPEVQPSSEARGGQERSAAAGSTTSPQATGTAPTPAPRTRELMALVERIEACVREGRPALTLELSGTGWSVDLERHALGGVILRLQAPRHGRAPDLETLRSELHARGVRVRELTCGRRAPEPLGFP